MLLPNTKVEGRALCPLGICPNKSCLWANLHGFLQVQQTSPALLLQVIHESLLRQKTQHLMLPSVHILWSGYLLKQSQEWYTLQIISHRSLSPFSLDGASMLRPTCLFPQTLSSLLKKNTTVAAIVCISPPPLLPTSYPPKTHMLKLNTLCDDIRKWGPLRYDKVVRVEPSWMELSS